MPRPKQPQHKRSAKTGIRLHKALADAGVGSRRACEAIIAEQRVSVNRQTVEASPFWVDPEVDRIMVDGQRVRRTAPSRLYLMINKPRGVICTNNDPEGRTSIVDLVPHKERLFCVGRLDAESTGLVLLTDDGDLAQTLTHPSFEITKTYSVAVAGHLSNEQVQKLEHGVWLTNKGSKASKTQGVKIELLSRDRQRSRLLITLREGRNREIRRMLAQMGLKPKRLERTAIGPLRLKELASNQWRRLSRTELGSLRSAVRRAKKSNAPPPKQKKRSSRRPSQSGPASNRKRSPRRGATR